MLFYFRPEEKQHSFFGYLMRVSILIPCYNDAVTIEKVIKETVEVGRRVAQKFEIIVINDGSTDGTANILAPLKKKYHGLSVITHSQNQGYGKTIKELYYTGKSEWLFTIPGDYQVGAKELRKLFAFREKADMIIGWRKKRKDPIARLVQSAVYNVLLNLLFGLRLHDVNSVRLMRRSILKKIVLKSESAFIDAELAIKAARTGFRVAEIAVGHRASRKQGSGGKWWTILPTIGEMIRYWLG